MLRNTAIIIKSWYSRTDCSRVILMGDVKRAGIYTSMIKERIDLSDVDMDMLKERPQMMMFSKARREDKLGGIKR